MVIDVPTAPEVGEIELISGVARTVNASPLLDFPLTVTTILPDVAPAGTSTPIELELHEVTLVTAVPLNLTVLDPCVEPKLLPLIVTAAPTAPEVVERLVIVGDDPAKARCAGDKVIQRTAAESSRVPFFMYSAASPKAGKAMLLTNVRLAPKTSYGARESLRRSDINSACSQFATIA